MSTPDQPSTPPLTRRQLREMRNTGSAPIVTPKTDPKPEKKPEPTPLPRAAEPAPIAPAPKADAAVNLGERPLTRRQAREQERIRTASVPVITPDLAGAPAVEPAPDAFTPPKREDGEHHDTPVATAEAALGLNEETEDEAAVTVSEQLGSQLLAGEKPEANLPPSFDELLVRERTTTGAVSTPNALILSQTPSSPLIGPVTATGEVIVTGTFDLPELGSHGHAPGTADGREADAVLIDGELPPASSPTPIAASAAVSTLKPADEIIRPPAPEKGSRLMLALAITAGALALALIGVLIVAVTTGVFS